MQIRRYWSSANPQSPFKAKCTPRDYLKRFPLDQLKIGQILVKNILTDAKDAAIAKMVIALAGSLGLAVIAEGVETAQQRGFLALQGCQMYQGYPFSKAIPLKEFEEFATRI
ncbi:MAG: EAL domain-containing protein [Burkholderiales bacterium]